jgi:hypothetical protein
VHTLQAANGRWDIGAELRADDVELFDKVLGRIRNVEGISSTETSILLSPHKGRVNCFPKMALRPGFQPASLIWDCR